jgi:hypothetical protein
MGLAILCHIFSTDDDDDDDDDDPSLHLVQYNIVKLNIPTSITMLKYNV